MVYDFNLVETLCESLAVTSLVKVDDRLEVELQPGVFLCFVNAQRDEDSLIGFKGTPWHVHGDLMFSDNHGYYIEMTYGDMMLGLAEGSILICERWRQGKIMDRWLMHSEYADEFRYMESGEEIRVKRARSRLTPREPVGRTTG